RSGKTYVMQMFRDDLLSSGTKDDQIIYLSFEDVNNLKYGNATALHDYVANNISQQKTYLFFDEIQRVTDWQVAINSFRVEFNVDIYITGSNASLLSGEMATLLAGRYVEIPVYPLSFKEFRNFKGVEAYPDIQFMEYLTVGGFPTAVLSDDDEVRKIVVSGIYDSIVLRDVASRAEIRNDGLLLRLTDYLFDQSGQIISPSKVAGVLKNEGWQTANAPTVTKYLDALTNAFIFYKVQRFDIRGKERLRTMAKYYGVDTGLRNTVLGTSYRDNIGRQLETVIYFELLRRGYGVNVGQYDDLEIDFVARKNNEIKYFQVTYQLPENSTRETTNLAHLPDGFEKVVLTMNRMDAGNIDGVKIIHAVDWLLEE
ncbi:MAG: ATP-binding protein, partial [Leuconostoc mesenteroides]